MDVHGQGKIALHQGRWGLMREKGGELITALVLIKLGC
jgi:hypothetical protein